MKEYVIAVDGMMCAMCEAHINDAVRSVADVKSVKADRKKKNVTVIAESFDAAKAAQAITSLGYEVGDVAVKEYEKRSFFGRLKK